MRKKKISTFYVACKVVKYVGIGAIVYGIVKPDSVAGTVLYSAIGKGIACLKNRTGGIGNMTLREVAVKFLEFIGKMCHGMSEHIGKVCNKEDEETEEEQEDEEEDEET